jgi:hypothetical protein
MSSDAIYLPKTAYLRFSASEHSRASEHSQASEGLGRHGTHLALSQRLSSAIFAHTTVTSVITTRLSGVIGSFAMAQLVTLASRALPSASYLANAPRPTSRLAG